MDGIHAENLDAAFDVGKKDSRAIVRENQAGITELAFLVLLEKMRRNGVGIEFVRLLSREGNPLCNPASRRIDDDQFVRLARGHEDVAVRAEGDRLWTHARQLHLNASRAQHLIHRSDHAVGSSRPNFLLRPDWNTRPAAGGSQKHSGRAEQSQQSRK